MYMSACVSAKNGKDVFYSILVKCPHRQIQSSRKKSVTSGIPMVQVSESYTL